MGQRISINRVTNSNLYVNGSSLLGRAEEVVLPSVVAKMVEHKSIGMVGTSEFFAGIEKMDMKIKWNSFYAEALKGNADFTKSLDFQIRASVESWDSAGRGDQVPLVIFVKAQYKNFPMGDFKQHDNSTLETMLNVHAIKMELNGEEIIEVDVLANIYKVNGVDMLTQYRNNLGI